MFRLAAAILVLCSAVTGCNPHRVDKNVHPLVESNDAYSLSGAGVEPERRWWESFGDWFLDRHVAEALSGNLTLKQAHARIEQAMADEKRASSFFYPEVTGEASGRSDWADREKPEDTYHAGAALSWEVDLWGRLSSAGNAAGYETMASREELEAAAMLLTARVAETYFQIIEQKLQLTLLERQIDAGETILELIELRFSYGEASVVDVYQQRQQLASTRVQVPLVQSRLRTLENRLHVQLGRSPVDGPLMTSEEFPQLPEMPSAGIPLHLLKSRPDLRRSYNRLIANDYRVAEAVADRLPKINLSGTAGYTDTFSVEGRLLTLLLEAAAPLFDGRRREAEVEKSRAVFREDLARYSEAYLIAIEEVENALWQERYQKDLLKALEEQMRISRSNLKETGNRYRQGLTDYLPVLTALQSLQQLEREILSRQRGLISIRILLYRALGGSRLTAMKSEPEASSGDKEKNKSEEVIK